MFEDVTHERSLILLLSIKDADLLRKIQFTGYETDINKNLALEKLQGQRIFKEHIAMSLIESQSE